MLRRLPIVPVGNPVKEPSEEHIVYLTPAAMKMIIAFKPNFPIRAPYAWNPDPVALTSQAD
jgi:hypothetical protein